MLFLKPDFWSGYLHEIASISLWFLTWVQQKLHFSISSRSCCIHQNRFFKRFRTMIELLPLPMKYLYMIFAGGSWRASFSSADGTTTAELSSPSFFDPPKVFYFGVLFKLEDESRVSSVSRSRELPGFSSVIGTTGVISRLSSFNFFQKANISFSLI